MIFLGESIYVSEGLKDGAGILIIKNSTYVDLLMIDDDENDEESAEDNRKGNSSESDIDVTHFLKENGYDLDKLWSEGYNIYYGYLRGVIFEIEVNLSLPS